MNQGIVDRLRNYESCHDGDIDQAADMLEFFFSCMQSHSLHMNGSRTFRFHSGWPLSSVAASTPEEAVVKAMLKVAEAAGTV